VALGSDAGAYVATIAEVEVDAAKGTVRVKRLVCIQDMGTCVNPEGAKIQMEGGSTMGMGYALTEEVHFSNGKVLDTNYDSYEIPRFSWVPKIETGYIDSKAAPQGGGEPSVITMGAVIANAIFDATGARLFQMPMTPERVKAAIAKA
jgi:CO/xanthine dehydrogenase Mo-binding subunit